MPRQGNPPGRHHPAGASHDETDATRASSGQVGPTRDGDAGRAEPAPAHLPAHLPVGPDPASAMSAPSRVSPASPASPVSDDALPGQPHGQVYFVLHTYVAPGYEIEFAPLAREPDGRALGSDIRVRKNGLDPTTSDRHVEELAFAIETGASQHARSGNAMDLHVQALQARGVRRIFAIGPSSPISTPGSGETTSARAPARARTETRPEDRGRATARGQARFARRPGPLREWAPARSAWRTYSDDAVIVDPCLGEPVPVRALLDAVEADRAVARALIERRVDVIEEYGTRRYDAGKDEGYRAGTSDGYRAGKDEGYRAGKDEGYRAGKNDGYRAGTNEGYRAGASEGMREAILLLLRARGIDVDRDEHAYARIAACNDMTILQRWLTRAAHVISATALFDDA
jgi:hypothetical protein